MYYVSAQGVDERMINVHYYYYYCFLWTLNTILLSLTYILDGFMLMNKIPTVICFDKNLIFF